MKKLKDLFKQAFKKTGWYKKKSHQALVRAIESGSPIIGRHPLNVQIQTVTACNAKCVFCPHQGSWQQRKPGRMGDEMFKKIIAELKEFNIERFCPYDQNEPLLDASLFDKIDFAVTQLNPRCVEISSNLGMLNDKHLYAFKDVISHIPHEIRVSFHGITKESYKEIMGLDFKKGLDNVMRLVGLAQDVPLNIEIRGAGAPKRKGSLKQWFTSEEYYKFWEKSLSRFKKKPHVLFFNYHDRAGSKQLKEKGMSFNIYRDSLEGFYCERFDRWVHFMYNGEPILCCMDYNMETAFGESIEKKSVNELFSSEQFVKMIKMGTGIVESDADFICKRCISPGG